MIIFNTENENKKDDNGEINVTLAETGNSMESIIEAAEAENEALENASNDKINHLVEVEFLKEHKTKFHKGNLRSGVSMDFDGSIIVLGDVNAGAEVKASGNIIILGALKGIAHAGANGESDAYIFALNMSPVQLRIADIITMFPENRITKSLKNPEYAYVEDGGVYVSAFE